jgi:hypothetical protein
MYPGQNYFMPEAARRFAEAIHKRRRRGAFRVIHCLFLQAVLQFQGMQPGLDREPLP